MEAEVRLVLNKKKRGAEPVAEVGECGFMLHGN